jgi:serine/threonine-protein kinase
MSSPEPLPTAFGRYQVLEELGAGAMGVVYLCVDPRLNRPVAIKVMRESDFRTPAEREQFEKRFRHEAEAAGRLTHPDIVQIYDVGPSWIVMEFLEGQPLSTLLRSGERLSVRRVVSLVTRVADAVDYAHRHGIIHRDIKPANIMLLEGDGVKVMDFGVARLEHSTLTALGTVVGSVRYMAPEQMMGERVDGRADVFSVAAVAYELLTGQAPFPGKTITEVVSRVVHGAHVPPQKADHRLPEAVDPVFARAFAPRPAERYELALDFARDLEAAVVPALDLDLAPARPASPAARTEVMAPTAVPAAALPASAGPALADATVLLGAAPEKGRLLVDLEPAGCAVELDGRPVEVPEQGLELPLGPHRVRLSREGHSEAACAFELTARDPVLHLSARLPPQAGGERPGYMALGDEAHPPRRLSGGLPVTPPGPSGGGLAVVDVYVSAAGEVMGVDEVAGEPRFSRALAEAVRRWRFHPARRSGSPVPVRLRVGHVFPA